MGNLQAIKTYLREFFIKFLQLPAMRGKLPILRPQLGERGIV